MVEGVITSRATKKIKVVGRCIYSFFGTTLFFEPAMEWHRGGANPAEAPKTEASNSWHLVVLDKNGLAVYNWDTPYPDYRKPPWAFGSNWELALGLMMAGKTAEEAVRTMCEQSIYVVGEIQVVNIAEALGQLREAAE